MANNTSDRVSRNGAPERPGWTVRETPKQQTLRERFGALRNLPPFFALIWKTSRSLTIASLSIRIVRAVLPVLALYVGKLIIDAVIAVTKIAPHPTTWQDWLASDLLHPLWWLLALELALAVLSDLLGRVASLTDRLLAAL